MITIAIGTDHRGYELKKYLVATSALEELSVSWRDAGTDVPERTDYPLYVPPVVRDVLDGVAQYGILICGSGIGMSIAANRHSGIRAALVWNKEVAAQAKVHDNANILVLPADYLDEHTALEMVRVWLQTEFIGGRYADRLDMIDNK